MVNLVETQEGDGARFVVNLAFSTQSFKLFYF